MPWKTVLPVEEQWRRRSRMQDAWTPSVGSRGNPGEEESEKPTDSALV